MSGVSPEHTRDISRIEWQRSVGHIIFSEMAEEILAAVPESTWNPLWFAELKDCEIDASNPWEVAYQAGLMFEDLASVALENSPLRQKIDKSGVNFQFSEFSFHRSMQNLAQETIPTAAHFPLHVLGTLNRLHEAVYSTPLITTTSSLQSALRSSDFSGMLHAMALAPNSYWPGDFSSRPYESDPIKYYRTDDYEEASDFPVKYKKLDEALLPDDTSVLGFRYKPNRALAQIRDQNQKGLSASESTVLHRATSGCPVRLATGAFNTPKSQQAVAKLAAVLGKSPAELMARRERSGIQIGLDSLISVLEQVDDFLQVHRGLAPAKLQS
ncbi:MAG: hypothetical protein JWM81_995 [Candidatus Saccharibacteria bacterium]|nr:hypothetical protein [Candidatus Saccharibacteria bacterium]